MLLIVQGERPETLCWWQVFLYEGDRFAGDINALPLSKSTQSLKNNQGCTFTEACGRVPVRSLPIPHLPKARII